MKATQATRKLYLILNQTHDRERRVSVPAMSQDLDINVTRRADGTISFITGEYTGQGDNFGRYPFMLSFGRRTGDIDTYPKDLAMTIYNNRDISARKAHMVRWFAIVKFLIEEGFIKMPEQIVIHHIPKEVRDSIACLFQDYEHAAMMRLFFYRV